MSALAPSQPIPEPTALPPFPPQPAGVPFPKEDWPNVSLDEHGLPHLDETYDKERLKRLLEAYESRVEADGHRALLVVKGGKIVLERYSNGTVPSTKLISWSVAKSWLQMLVGRVIAISGGDVNEALDTPLGSSIPEWSTDERRNITLRTLLQMRSGLDFVEQYTLQHPETGQWSIPDVVRMLMLDHSSDPSSFALNKPLAAPPGDKWYYSSGTSNIVSRIITSRLGLLPSEKNPLERTWSGFLGRMFWPTMVHYRLSRPDTVLYNNPGMQSWMKEHLLSPIGIRDAYPQFDAAGVWIGSSYVFATARDFARFGLLYLRDGVWDGNRLLPEGWCDMARQRTAVNTVDKDALFDYGMHWWIPKTPGKHEELGWFSANGFQGQMVVVVPKLDMVIVRLGKTEDPDGFNRVFRSVVEELVEIFGG